jgi:hypothetical protein
VLKAKLHSNLTVPAGFLLLVLLNREISAVPLVVTMGLGSN